MENKRLFVTAAVTVILAIGAGHIMQYGLTPTATELSSNPPPRPSSLRPDLPHPAASSILMQGVAIEGEASSEIPGDTEAELSAPRGVSLTSGAALN